MIHCPNCNATLPDYVSRCHFCGSTFANQNLPPKMRAASGGYDATGRPKWVWPAYYGIAGWWILTGAVGIAQGLLLQHGGGIVGTAAGVLNVVFGLGLMARVEIVRGITNVVCFINIVFGLFSLVGAFLASAIFGLLGAIEMVVCMVNIGAAVFLMFLIGETDTLPPKL